MFVTETVFILKQITEYRFGALSEISEKLSIKSKIFYDFAVLAQHLVFWKTQRLGSFALTVIACATNVYFFQGEK